MTTMAAPVTYAAGTTTMAAPVTYAAAAPVAYETVAAPAVTYAAPQVVETVAAAPTVVETVAAPAVTYAPQTVQAAPQVITQVPSYVAPPMGIQVPQQPVAPPKLTTGIPTPDQIAQQKAGYAAALDKQLKEAIETVQKETAIEKEMIKFTAEKTIALYNMQVDEKLTEAMALADEQATFALLELNKAKVERNLQLTAQANGLVMDYQMKAVQTELAQKQYAFQVEYQKAEGALEKQYAEQVAKANTGTTYTIPAQTVAAK